MKMALLIAKDGFEKVVNVPTDNQGYPYPVYLIADKAPLLPRSVSAFVDGELTSLTKREFRIKHDKSFNTLLVYEEV